MNKIIIALGLTLAASTGAFAQTNAMDAYVPQPANSAGIDDTATASIGGVANDLVTYDRAGNDGSPDIPGFRRLASACRHRLHRNGFDRRRVKRTGSLTIAPAMTVRLRSTKRPPSP